jgi:hypothetical protein
MMAGHGDKSRRWELAIGALMSEATVEAAARKARVGYRTLKGWLALPEFQAAYRQARQEVVERTVARLLALTGKAVETLDRNLTCGRPAAEIRAAELALAQGYKGVEVLDLAQEVEELKRLIQEMRHGQRNPETGTSEAPAEHRPGGSPPDGGGAGPAG